MTIRGPRPKDRRLKLLASTLRPGRDRHATALGPGPAPIAPAWLPVGVRVEFNRLAALLAGRGAVAEATGLQLAIYLCVGAKVAAMLGADELPTASLLAQHRALARVLRLDEVAKAPAPHSTNRFLRFARRP